MEARPHVESRMDGGDTREGCYTLDTVPRDTREGCYTLDTVPRDTRDGCYTLDCRHVSWAWARAPPRPTATPLTPPWSHSSGSGGSGASSEEVRNKLFFLKGKCIRNK